MMDNRTSAAIFGSALCNDLTGWSCYELDDADIDESFEDLSFYLGCGDGFDLSADIDAYSLDFHQRYGISLRGTLRMEVMGVALRSLDRDDGFVFESDGLRCVMGCNPRSCRYTPRSGKRPIPLNKYGDTVENRYYTPNSEYAGTETDRVISELDHQEMDRLIALMYMDDESDILSGRADYHLSRNLHLSLIPNPLSKYISVFDCTLEYSSDDWSKHITAHGMLSKNYRGLVLLCNCGEIGIDVDDVTKITEYSDQKTKRTIEYLKERPYADYSGFLTDREKNEMRGENE